MPKVRTSISIDEDLYGLVKSELELNFSGLVNRLLRRYFTGTRKVDKSALESRLRSLKEEKSSLGDRIEEIDATINHLHEEIEEKEQKETGLEKDLRNWIDHYRREGTLSGYGYKHFAEVYGLSKEGVHERIEEIIG